MNASRLLWVLLFFFSLTMFRIDAAISAPCSREVVRICTTCHAEARICFKVRKKKSQRIWKRIVLRMIKHGADADPETRKRLIGCLATPTADLRELCGMDTP